MQHIAEVLRNKNIKLTPQRLAIYKVLYNTTAHPSAEMIYQELLPSHPTMSLATVYKTLDSLKQAGLVQELNTGGDSFRYDAVTTFHPHMICLECNNVYDLHTDSLNDLCSTVQDETDFELQKCQVYFYGKCPSCKD